MLDEWSDDLAQWRKELGGVVTPPSTVVYLGLGSNLGDRAANLWQSVKLVAGIEQCRVARISPLYETEPVGVIPQGLFLNAAARVETTLSPLALLRCAKRIERVMGREPGERWGPRLIDVDVLLFGDVRMATRELTLPHPEMWNRRFVLVPLREVAHDEDLKARIDESLAALASTPFVRPYPEV